jgi:hypothetical protein
MRWPLAADAPLGGPGMSSVGIASFAGILEPGEVVIIATRPSLWFVILKRLGSLLAVLAFSVLAIYVDVMDVFDVSAPVILTANALAAGLTMGWFAIDRSCRAYVLTDRRVLRVSGVFRQVIIEAPLRHVQTVTLYRSIRERGTGVGTIVFSTAGVGGAAGEFSWFMVDRPHDRIGVIRETIGKYGRGT